MSSHANRGKALEVLLEARRAWNRDTLIIRLGPPGFYRQVAGKLVWTVSGNFPPDYLAIRGGRAVIADAKQAEEDYWKFGHLEKHQAKMLDRGHDCGAVAGLVVRVGGDAGAIWWVPWPALRERWWAWYRTTARVGAGEGSLSGAWLATVARPVRGADWVSAALGEPSRAPVTLGRGVDPDDVPF